MSTAPPITVGALIVRMRRMLGHLGARDRQTVCDAIGGLEELANRLHKASQAATTPVRKRTTITHVAGDELEREVCIVGGYCSVHKTAERHYKGDGSPVAVDTTPEDLMRDTYDARGPVHVSVNPLDPYGLTPRKHGVITDIEDPDARDEGTPR